MDKVQKVNQKYYNANAKRWAEIKTHSFYSEKEFKKFVTYFKNGAKILDVGCGYGRDVPLFLGIGRKLKYEGFDISEKFLDIAEARYPQLKFHCGNLLQIETLPEGFDGIWAAAVLQHVPEKDWSVMLDNLEKILNKRGVIYFTLPEDRPNPASKEDPRHFSLFTKAKVHTIIKDRKWTLMEEGILPATRGTSKWRWYICKFQ